MFILHLPLAVFSFLVKSSSFAFASKARISMHYSHLCTLLIFQENQEPIKGKPGAAPEENINANLGFAVCPKQDS